MKRVSTRWLLALIALAPLVAVSIVAADFGSNWSAQFYNNTNLSGEPVVTQSGLPGINFTWGSGSPAANVNNDDFSARFTSSQILAGGTYDFVVAADDGVRVFIDGVNVLDRFVPRALTTDRFTQTLSAGAHSFVVEYFEAGDQASIRFEWFPVAGTVITPGVFTTPAFVPTAIPVTAVPTPLPPIPEGAMTATVINARVLVVRIAPYIGAEVVGRIRRGETYAIVGRDDDARWFLLQLHDRQAWAYGFYLFVNGNEFNPPVVSSFITLGNPAALSGVVGQSHQGLRLRAAPTTESEQIGRVVWGDIMPIVGRNADNSWYQVIYKNTLGWVTSAYMRVLEGDVNALPVTG